MASNQILTRVRSDSKSLYKPAFKREEYQMRISKLTSMMSKNHYKMIIICSPQNINYFTGFDGWSFYVPQFLIVFLKGNDYHTKLVLRGMDSSAGLSTTYLPQDDILYYPDKYIDNTECHPIELIDNMLREIHGGSSSFRLTRVGLESDATYFRARYLNELLRLGYTQLLDATLKINEIRMIKSQAELEYIRRASVIADMVMDTAITHICSGNTGAYVASKIAEVQYNFGTPVAICPMVMVDEDGAHMNWTNDIFKKGQKVFLELAASYHHYHCPISRCVVVGEKADEETTRIGNIILQSLTNALDMVRIGNAMDDVYWAFENTMNENGLSKRSRIGYSFGLGFVPDWGENTFSIRPDDNRKIQENMCIHLIAGCGDSWGVQMSESIIVKKDGPEMICGFPRNVFLSDHRIRNNTLNYINTLQKYCPKQKTKDWNCNIYMNPHRDKLMNETGDVCRKMLCKTEMPIDKTPLVELSVLAKELGVGGIFMKDESCRMGTDAFKILGVSYAVEQMIKRGELKPGDTVTTMTDGNHGCALARIARDLSMNAVIFVPSNMVPARMNKIKEMGAVLEIVEGTYDDAVEYATARAQTDGMKFISDQSFDGYEKIPSDIMTGYIDLFKEVEMQHDTKYTHIFLQAGVGGFAGAGMAWSVGSNSSYQAKVICVEPEDADCLMESAKQNKMSHSKGNIDSIMAGLNCGYPSKLAFPIIRERTDCFVSLGNNWAKHGCRILSKNGVIAGESGCAGLSALMGLLTHGDNETLKELELNNRSIILLINTEGNTDPTMYDKIINDETF